MSRVLSTEPVRVRIGDCECPGKPHAEGDHGYLRPRLSPEGGLEASSLLMGWTGDVPTLMRRLGTVYLRDGLISWDILDDDGREFPVSEWASGKLDWDQTLLPLAEEADRLYSPGVMRPLVDAAATSKSSRNGRTAVSTSRKRSSSAASRKR